MIAAKVRARSASCTSFCGLLHLVEQTTGPCLGFRCQAGDMRDKKLLPVMMTAVDAEIRPLRCLPVAPVPGCDSDQDMEQYGTATCLPCMKDHLWIVPAFSKWLDVVPLLDFDACTTISLSSRYLHCTPGSLIKQTSAVPPAGSQLYLLGEGLPVFSFRSIGGSLSLSPAQFSCGGSPSLQVRC